MLTVAKDQNKLNPEQSSIPIVPLRSIKFYLRYEISWECKVFQMHMKAHT